MASGFHERGEIAQLAVVPTDMILSAVFSPNDWGLRDVQLNLRTRLIYDPRRLSEARARKCHSQLTGGPA